MIRVHHLNNSRSQRILWLLEEIGLPYEIVRYQRHKRTMLAPDALKRIHPLGKSPVIDDDGKTFAETGLIIEYLVDLYGRELAPPRPSDLYWRYKYWLHYAEGSLMPPLLLKLVIDRLGLLALPARKFVTSQLKLHRLSGSSAWRRAMVPGRAFLRSRHHVELPARGCQGSGRTR